MEGPGPKHAASAHKFRKLGPRAQEKAIIAGAQLAQDTRVQLARLGYGACVALPPARSFKGEDSVRRRFALGSGAAELALQVAQARLSMAGAVSTPTRRGKAIVEAGPAMPASPPQRSPAEQKAKPCPKARVASRIPLELSCSEKHGPDDCLSVSKGRPRRHPELHQIAAELASEMRSAIDAECKEAQPLHHVKNVRKRLRIGTATAENVIRLAKARLSMAGFRASVNKKAPKQFFYVKPDVGAAAVPSFEPAVQARPSWVREIGPSALLQRLQSKGSVSPGNRAATGCTVVASHATAMKKEILDQHVEQHSSGGSAEHAAAAHSPSVKQEVCTSHNCGTGAVARRLYRKTSMKAAGALLQLVKREPRPRWRAGVLTVGLSQADKHWRGRTPVGIAKHSKATLDTRTHLGRTNQQHEQAPTQKCKMEQKSQSSGMNFRTVKCKRERTVKSTGNKSCGSGRSTTAKRKSQCNGLAFWRRSRWFKPLRQLRQQLFTCQERGGRLHSVAFSTMPSQQISKPTEREVMTTSRDLLCVSQVPGWSMRLVLFLGRTSKIAMPLACASRHLTWALLRDSQQLVAELRMERIRLTTVKHWQALDQADLERTQGVIGVLAALVPLEPRRRRRAVASTAAMAADVWHQDALPLRSAKRQRTSTCSTASASSRGARQRTLAEAKCEVDRARVLRLDLLLQSLSRQMSSATQSQEA